MNPHMNLNRIYVGVAVDLKMDLCMNLDQAYVGVVESEAVLCVNVL